MQNVGSALTLQEGPEVQTLGASGWSWWSSCTGAPVDCVACKDNFENVVLQTQTFSGQTIIMVACN